MLLSLIFHLLSPVGPYGNDYYFCRSICCQKQSSPPQMRIKIFFFSFVKMLPSQWVEKALILCILESKWRDIVPVSHFALWIKVKLRKTFHSRKLRYNSRGSRSMEIFIFPRDSKWQKNEALNFNLVNRDTFQVEADQWSY